MHKRSLFSMALFLSFLTSMVVPGWTGAAILGNGWPYRLPLKVQVLRCGAPGKNIAWAQFYTNSARLPDGKDLRVTTSGRLILPMRIMRISRFDDRVRLAFETPSSGTYYVWWGNPHPGPAAPILKVDRGIWLRLLNFRPGGSGSGQAMAARIARAKCYASYFVPDIFIGFNPAGQNGRAMALCQSWLKIPKAGSYTFAFDVNGVGYFTLDGHNILIKSQRSGMYGRVRFNRRVNLKVGWHRVVVGAINYWGQIGMALDWMPPGTRRYSPVPQNLYAPIARASVGRLQKIGQTYAADFAIHPEAQVFVPPSYYFQRFAFQALIPASFSPQVTWRFSDGQTASGLRVEHEFLTPGIYKIQMTVQQGSREFTATRRLRIRSVLYQMYPFPPADPLVMVARILKSYNLATLDARQLAHGVRFYRRYNTFPGLARWGRAWATNREPERDISAVRIAGILAKAALAKKQYAWAAQVYLLASQKPLNLDAKARLLAHYVVTTCNYTTRASTAYAYARKFLIQSVHGSAAARHVVLTALAYAAVANGNGKLAVRLAEQAGPGVDKAYRQQEIQEGVLARNIESYILTGHFDTARHLITQWELDYPRAIIKGYTRLLRMKLLLAQGRPLIAAKIGVQYVNALPASFYSAKLLYRAALALKVAGKADAARSIMARLKHDYPESPYGLRLAKQLGQ